MLTKVTKTDSTRLDRRRKIIAGLLKTQAGDLLVLGLGCFACAVDGHGDWGRWWCGWEGIMELGF
jgi:hypothetical protein